MRGRPLFEKKDLFVLLAIALAALTLWEIGFKPASGVIVCELTLMGGATELVDLGKDGRFSLFGLDEVVFEVRDGKIAFVASDCADKTCVHTGFISRAGQIAVCLPNKVAVKLSAKKSADELDAIIR